MKNLIYLLVFIISIVSCKSDKKKIIDVDKEEVIVTSQKVEDIQLSNGTLERIKNFPSKFVKPRNVDVWLPENYSKIKKYAVYMHDGQMLFDSTKTWNKQEWKVDEVASKLIKEEKVKDFIVVAIWNISEIRWQDYFPEKSWDFIPEQIQNDLISEGNKNNFKIQFNADNYLKFIVNEVKPLIDSVYSTLPDRENTIVAGSSMGGLISMYAMFEYPEVFGSAACISTHWPGTVSRENNPMTNGFFDYIKSKARFGGYQKFYFDYGTETLDAHYPQYAKEVDAIFKAKGFDEDNYKNLMFEGAAHNEVSWANRLDIPLTFLLGNSDE